MWGGLNSIECNTTVQNHPAGTVGSASGLRSAVGSSMGPMSAAVGKANTKEWIGINGTKMKDPKQETSSR